MRLSHLSAPRRPRGRRQLLVLVALISSLGSALLIAAQSLPASADVLQSPECIKRTAPIQPSLTLVNTEQIDARTTIYSFKSGAVGQIFADGLVRARVIVPQAYLDHPGQPFPVLYHMHGANNSPTTWPASEVQQVLGDTPVIFVQPDAGPTGGYSDWYGRPITGFDALNGPIPDPAPAWETFHNVELLPWIDSHLHTTGHHSISGSSMGGFGAMSYAERYPQLYDAAASLSGLVDLHSLYPVTPLVAISLYDPCVWGDPVIQADNWDAHNPIKHVDRLRGVSLFVTAGNGLPGKYDDETTPPQAPVFEVLMHQEALDFVDALNAQNVPVTTRFYGNGTHPDGTGTSRHYDYESLENFLPQAMAAMQRPS